jgi:serine/threonine protein kinase
MVGPYRLIQRLGEGGMGVVHLALDPHGKAVALKMLPVHASADPHARLRLSREVATLRRVRHPLVSEVLDADVEGGLPYLVTRFVPGLPLDAHVARYGPLTRPQVAHLARGMADALSAIHAVGVVHRDVKPANVMLVDGEPMLIDFGIAQLADESRITLTGLVMGTPGYLSPEVIAGGEVTAASDWWGWGATLAYAATGRPPFGTGAVEVVLDRVRRGQCDLEGLDGPVRAALAAALSPDPARRAKPASLVAGLEGEPVRPRPSRAPGDRSPATEMLRMPPTRRDPAVPPAPAPQAPRQRPAAVARAAGQPAAPRPANPYASPPRPAARANAVPIPVTPSGSPPVPVSPPPATVRTPPPAARPRAGPAPAALDEEPSVTAEEAPGRSGFRMLTLLCGLVALCATAVVAPAVAVLLAGAVMVVARIVDASVTSLLRRRHESGRRGSDVPVTILALPYHALIAALHTCLGLLLPMVVGLSAAFMIGLGDLRNGVPSPAGAPALAGGMAALLLTAWWGPGGGSVRRGSRAIVRGAGRSRAGAWMLLGVFVLLSVSALSAASNGAGPDYWPVQPPSIGGLLSNWVW